MSFPKDFRWGAATSSYQVEGAWNTDGKGASIWDVFAHTKGKIFHGDTGDLACDHYHRYAEDAALMKEIGLKAYRFSTSWPRILPEGRGTIAPAGLDFYDKLVDSLLQAGVEPWCTLYHWDLPQALQLQGGWANPAIADDFAAYARILGDRLGDRVKNWFTLNEPQCMTGLSYGSGHHAPGLKAGLSTLVPVIHNALRAHGAAVKALRSSVSDARIGFAPTGAGVMPATETVADIEAARREVFRFHDNDRLWTMGWYIDPVIKGEYPADGLEVLEPWLPRTWQADMADIAQPLDFIGLNLYNGNMIKADAGGNPVEVDRHPGHAMSAMKWPITPAILYWTPRFFHERYGLPLVISENGISSMDWVHLDGAIHDHGRIDYINRYLSWLKRGADEGIPLKAYFYWTLMDNFEWTEGYKERFGLIHVDFASLKRTLKDSARHYAGIIRTNGENLPRPAEPRL